MRMKIVKKPWGHEKVFTFNQVSTVKILDIKPGSVLSFQKHRKRKEIWYFITDGWVQLVNRKMKIKAGKSVIINKNTLHRLYSKDKKVLVLEVSLGKFEWDDIIRLEDRYGRE